MQKSVFVIIPNYNGADRLAASIDSVLAQSYRHITLVVVDNGSTDGSRTIIEQYLAKDERVRAVWRDKNYGYTGGVNPGFELAIEQHATYAAPFNNDAIADKDWLKNLIDFLDTHDSFGIAACKLLHADGKTFDSTADLYTSWGLPYPRGRDEPVSKKYDGQTTVFGASGGASMYRVSMLAKIGLFDQDFFAYYEDIDLSFRAQLAGWKVGFVPASLVYHEQGVTSARLRNGFTTKQFMKNLPMVIVKDMPARLWWRVVPRFTVVYTIFFVKALCSPVAGSALNGWLTAWRLLPKKLSERWRIQKNRTVSSEYIWSLFVHDLPPNAAKLRKIRAAWWRIIGKHKGKEIS